MAHTLGDTYRGDMSQVRTISEVNGFDILFYNPLDFLNYGVSELEASISRDLFKYMYSPNHTLVGQFTSLEMGFSVLYMIDPKQCTRGETWTADGHIDMTIKIYRVKVLYDIEILQASSKEGSGVETWKVNDCAFYVRHNFSQGYVGKTFVHAGQYRNVPYDFTSEATVVQKQSNQFEEKLYYYQSGYYVVQGKGLRGLRGY